MSIPSAPRVKTLLAPAGRTLPALATPAAMVPMPALATSLTETLASGLTFGSRPVPPALRRWVERCCDVGLQMVFGVPGHVLVIDHGTCSNV